VGDDPPGLEAERRAQLGGVEDGQPPGRAGPEVEHPPAGGEGLGRHVDGPGELGQRLGDRVGHGGVLAVDQPQHVDGGQLVDAGRAGIAGLGG
jgi:hypothetical protein